MRTLSCAVFYLLCGLVLQPTLATASGNVLVPVDTSSNPASSPSLGLTAPVAPISPAPDSAPATPTKAPAPPSPTTSSTTAPLAASVSPPSAPPSPESNMGTQQQPPIASNMNPATAKALQALSQTQTNMIQSIVSPQDAAKLPRGTIPTHIIQQQDLGDLITQAGQKLPYSLAIGFGGGSLFGAKDVQTITAKLGLTANEIPSQCFLTARGIMQTSTGGYMIMGSNPPPLRVAYDGIIKSYLLGALAFCNADIKRIPQGSGFLNQNKGRFMIPLQSIKCPAPTRQVTSLIITYNGTASTSCSYQ